MNLGEYGQQKRARKNGHRASMANVAGGTEPTEMEMCGRANGSVHPNGLDSWVFPPDAMVRSMRARVDGASGGAGGECRGGRCGGHILWSPAQLA